jgi:hypothetical protein
MQNKVLYVLNFKKDLTFRRSIYFKYFYEKFNKNNDNNSRKTK